MSAGVLVQESEKGKVFVCKVWNTITVGSDEMSDFLIASEGVEPQHCELYPEFDGRLKVKDLSDSGTFLNGVRLQGEAHALLGDKLRLGPSLHLELVGILDPKRPRRAKGILTLPQRLEPRHIIFRMIGRGAAGLVYEAWDEEARRRCAIKLLLAGGRAHPELIARFKREAELQATLSDYPGIVSVWDLGIAPESGELYCVMEFVTGTTLRERIRQGMTRVEAVRMMARVCRAADYAHEHGLIHRDLKPRNVMVSDRGVIRLMDFGLCKALEDDEGLTATGTTLGTPCYMAPEQIEDAKHVGREADVYSLGAIFYVALTGNLPFAGSNLTQVLDAVANGVFTQPREVDPSIDAELNDIALKAMSLKPKNRYGSAMDMARALETWAKRVAPPSKVTLQPPTPTKRRKKRRKK